MPDRDTRPTRPRIAIIASAFCALVFVAALGYVALALRYESLKPNPKTDRFAAMLAQVPGASAHFSRFTVTQMALSRVPALRGGVALVATLAGLVVTAALSDGLSISGLTTWLLATVIVWLIALVGVLLLPLVLVKRSVQDRSRERR